MDSYEGDDSVTVDKIVTRLIRQTNERILCMRYIYSVKEVTHKYGYISLDKKWFSPSRTVGVLKSTKFYPMERNEDGSYYARCYKHHTAIYVSEKVIQALDHYMIEEVLLK